MVKNKMKKTYIAPEFFAVELGNRKNFMLTASDHTGTIISDGGEGDGEDIGAKEITVKNIWDEEW